MGLYLHINMSEKSISEYISTVYRPNDSIIYREFNISYISGAEVEEIEETIGTDHDYFWFKIALFKKLDQKN